MPFHKPVYIAAGYNTVYFGPGRKEFDPHKPMPPFEDYLKETAAGTLKQIKDLSQIDEGILASFMAPRFLNQANLPGFLPFMVPELDKKGCTGVEGACGSGGRAIAMGVRSVLSGLSDTVFVAGFEIQNSVKSLYGADILAGAAYYKGERKEGDAFFFPGIFSKRAVAYMEKYGAEITREAFAHWYERAILNARKNPKAQEYHNASKNLKQLGMTAPNPEIFLAGLNLFDCSKISDGASSLIVASAEGLKKIGVPLDQAIQIIGIGEAEADITKPPEDPTRMTTTEAAVQKALKSSNMKVKDMGLFEVHDCFTISGLLSIEAMGLAPIGKGAETILSQELPINSSGGLIGFGHPTGATGVRMMVDLYEQLTRKAPNLQNVKNPFGMMVSMGGNDKTVTSFIVKTPETML